MPINKAVLAAFSAATRLRPDIKEFYATQRAAEDVLAKLTLRDPRCRIEDISAPMPDGFEVRLRVFTPLDIDFSLVSGLKVTEDSRGTILFFHGGGWVNGDVDFYTDACTSMALRLERRVVSVDYRRAPEHRFPQAPEDCYEVTRQLLAGELLADVDADNVVLFGDSAGGNLAAVVSLMARDRREFAVRTQMLLYPVTYNDHDPSTSFFDSVRENGEDYLLSSRDIKGYMELYASKPADLHDPYFAPLLEPDLSDQPRTLVITAEYCPLRDEGEVYAQRLADDGGVSQCYRVLDAVHGYLLYPTVFNIVKDTYRIIKSFLDGDELSQEGEPAWLEILGTA
ncbi:alpha/beta hydrolase [Gordonibacter massiliensis (ex Traore et al. 2017)]|uniref:alpha/beta hydrolase n=1 Tax=Gordonibacter massiliensis (ex Traore et al. 2017) TaxID=1841863 RepID=UPI001C8CC2BE|nr:alpha/beta hydrolase [Gordonibacter massiliensis (ex Traore et al. 2017)]MBX9035299.1 alpha/beta hydrolase [Gordonibacter massiliensis (ex Traore et al. 2017)]